MAYFALIKNGIVKNVIVADQSYVDSLENSNDYIETFKDGKRGLFAGPGMEYDFDKDQFVHEIVEEAPTDSLPE